MSLFSRTGSLFQNALINGNFDINQRGTTAVTGNGLFASDRWKTYYDGAGTVAAQVITNEGDELGSNNLKLTLTTKSTTANFYIFQSLETINSIPFRGKTVTFSCLLKKNAAFSSGSMSVTLTTGTGVDQSYGNGGLATNRIVTASELSSSVYQKFSVTGVIPINTNQITAWVTIVRDEMYTCGPDTSAIQVKQCQLNEGSIALPFQPRHYAEELALCQRYCYSVFYGGGALIYVPFAVGGNRNDTTGIFLIKFPTQMLKTATLSPLSSAANTFTLKILDGTGIACSSYAITILNNSAAYGEFYVAAGLGGKNVIFLESTSSSVLIFTAEL